MILMKFLILLFIKYDRIDDFNRIRFKLYEIDLFIILLLLFNVYAELFFWSFSDTFLLLRAWSQTDLQLLQIKAFYVSASEGSDRDVYLF